MIENLPIQRWDVICDDERVGRAFVSPDITNLKNVTVSFVAMPSPDFGDESAELKLGSTGHHSVPKDEWEDALEKIVERHLDYEPKTMEICTVEAPRSFKRSEKTDKVADQ